MATTTLRPSPTALLDPLCDSSFKAMFTADTKESNAALKDFLSTILSREIMEVQLMPNEPPTQVAKESQMSFDVSVKFNDGERADIEVQTRSEDYDYADRAEIQVARLLSTSNMKGDNWDTPPAYQISVLNFEFDKDDSSPLSWYNMRKADGTQLSDKLNVVFFDLIKIHKLFGKPVENLSKLEKWGLFLSYAGDERRAEYIDRLTQSEEGIMNAKSSLCMVSEDEIKWAQQNSIFKAQRDYNTGMQNAEKRGIKKGIAQGAQQNAIANAKNMLTDNVSPEQVVKWTFLPLEQVLALKEELSHELTAVSD